MSLFHKMLFEAKLAAQQAVKDGLTLPIVDPLFERCPTLNYNGYMRVTVREITKKFLDIAVQPKAKVLEIGAAFGNVCLRALESGATNYTAMDKEEKHLKILARCVQEKFPEKLEYVKLVAGEFPSKEVYECFEEGAYDAILSENMLYYLYGDNLKEVRAKICKNSQKC